MSQDHFARLLRWLRMEGEAEAEQWRRRRQLAQGDPERTGESLLDLAIARQETGLAGRALLTLVKRNRTLPLPWNRLRVGSPVLLSAEDSTDAPAAGVVTFRRSDAIEVAVEDWPEADRFRVDLAPDEITRQRQAAALETAAEARGRVRVLREILLGERQPGFSPPKDYLFGAALNDSQQEAIRFALAADDLAIIHGPPGTGKTTTVVELIGQAVERGWKVLACAPSNTAVDNLLERLIADRRRVVRLGHPARVDARLRDFTLDAQVAGHELLALVKVMQREARELFRRADRFTRARPAPGEKQELRRQARELRADARRLEQQAVDSVLDRAQVVCATATLPEELLADRQFDLAVIDEACQTTEPSCWIPLLRADRLILAGDHCQLPPTVLSAPAAREGFSISLLERLVARHGDAVTRRLTVQYRMHADIMAFSSARFYENSLVADASVAAHRLHDLPGVEATPLTTDPVTFIDTAGADWTEELEPDGESRRNPREGELILRKVRQLLDAGLQAGQLAVITPYAAQVRWLRDAWSGADLEIDTVDGFQGREKEAVLISCVRSNDVGEIGFLGDTRRMNVALTRARRKLLIVGDSSTLGGHPFYADLLAWVESLGGYRSVWEEPSDDSP